jgi:hypothetical protein
MAGPVKRVGVSLFALATLPVEKAAQQKILIKLCDGTLLRAFTELCIVNQLATSTELRTLIFVAGCKFTVLLVLFDQAEGLDIFMRNVHVGVRIQASLSSCDEKSHKQADEAKGWRRHEVDRESVVSSHDRLYCRIQISFYMHGKRFNGTNRWMAQCQDTTKGYRQSKSRSPLGKVVIVEGISCCRQLEIKVHSDCKREMKKRPGRPNA